MARASATTSARSRLVPLAIALAVVFTFLPIRYSRWLDNFGQLAEVLIGPIAGPLSSFGRTISPASRKPPEPELVQRLQNERDIFETLYNQERNENERLNRIIEQLQRGIALNPRLPVRQLAAPVISTPSNLAGVLTVRAGSRLGVQRNSVAVVDGVQLVGRVTRVGPATCWVLPVTDRAAGSIESQVMLDDAGVGLACLLTPGDDGTLSGPLQDPSERGLPPDVRVEPGMVVRLLDNSGAWPASARMLVVGEVVRVEDDPDQPLRQRVVVRPPLRLDRVSEVTLRIPQAEGDASETGGNSGGNSGGGQ